MKKEMVLTLGSLVLLIGAGAWQPDPDKAVYIPLSPQRSGNADTGYQYLITGDYVKSGIPYDFFLLGVGKSKTNYLQRQGLNANVSHEYTVVKAANGEPVVAPNCLQCHSQVFRGSLVVGMGNSLADFSFGQKLNPQAYALLEGMLKKSSPAKYEATRDFLKVARAIGPQIATATRGVNAADRLAAVLAAHRNPLDFTWSDSALMPLPAEVIPSDVPAWWLLKKKHGMFYNGFGRGDFGRFLMASNLLTVRDSSESREVDNRISNVLAFINTLRPPPYPGKLDASLVKKGARIFVLNCSKCHGKYGPDGDYPNLLIPETVIRTDSFLFKSNYQNPQFVDWFNKSWFASGDHPARLEPFNGYIAPPLDGIWCTAPYFHNGSVPNLEGVLNSHARPAFWERDFSNPEYDLENPGWKFTLRQGPGGNTVYNTQLRGYGNYGHYFGDRLSPGDRKAVIEYLKTL